MRVGISHAFAVDTRKPVQTGVRWDKFHNVGRFDVHFEQLANPPQVHVVKDGLQLVVRNTAGNALWLNDVRVSVISANIEVVFVVLEYEADLTGEIIVDHLYTMCRARHKIKIDDLLFSSWIARWVSGGIGVSLATDVLQVIDFREGVSTTLSDGAGATALCQSLVSREWFTERRPTAVEFPSELNRSAEACFAHGRGVIVSAGHKPYVVAGALMAVMDLLFAAAEVRRIRHRLSTEIEILRRHSPDRRDDDQKADLQRIVTEIRQSRLTLAVDVIPAITGVATPDRVLDSVRESFARSLRISAIVDGAHTLLSTLTQIVETWMAEQNIASSARFEHRQRQWQFSVSVLSGLVVPFALLLSFFGTGTQGDVHPMTSMWDLGHYWPVWTVATISVLSVLAVSGWRYWRWLRGASHR